MRKLQAEYVLPLRREESEDITELTGYLAELSRLVDVTVVDGSPEAVFAQHAGAWGDFVRHLPVCGSTANGKVAGVSTGVHRARWDKVVVADDDVRHDAQSLTTLVGLLDRGDLVRPQNYFSSWPWHARWDTARSLLNRGFGADYPGTIALRRSVFIRMGGYCGAVLFENLELIRTVRAWGGREVVASDVYVPRRPPTVRHFFGQRIRQAYDSMAQPARLTAELALLPGALGCAKWSPRLLPIAAFGAMAMAEHGRRRHGGGRVFPPTAALWAPLWLVERSVCVWVALWRRGTGGVHYAGSSLTRAAHSVKELKPSSSRAWRCPEPRCSCVRFDPAPVAEAQ